MSKKGWVYKEKYSMVDIHAPPTQHKTAFEAGKVLDYYVRGYPEAKAVLKEWTITLDKNPVYVMGSPNAKAFASGSKKELRGILEGSNLPDEPFDLVGRFELPDGSLVTQAIEGIVILSKTTNTGSKSYGFYKEVTSYSFQAIRLGPVEEIIEADVKETPEPPKPTRMELLIL